MAFADYHVENDGWGGSYTVPAEQFRQWSDHARKIKADLWRSAGERAIAAIMDRLAREDEADLLRQAREAGFIPTRIKNAGRIAYEQAGGEWR